MEEEPLYNGRPSPPLPAVPRLRPPKAKYRKSGGSRRSPKWSAPRSKASSAQKQV